MMLCENSYRRVFAGNVKIYLSTKKRKKEKIGKNWKGITEL